MSTIGEDPRSQRLGDQQAVTGEEEGDTPSHRAAEGEGVRAPLASEGADHSEFSVFDGKGNEQVVVVTENDDGEAVQSTGDSSEEATKAAGKLDTKLGTGFGPH